MALGFSSHYKQGEHTSFGTLTHTSYNSESESAGTSANTNSGSILNSNVAYDCCDLSSSVIIDYTQYANIIISDCSSETAGSVAYSGGDCSSASCGTVVVSSASGSCSSGGSSASFTC